MHDKYTFKNQLIKIFNHMNHIDGDYVRFVLTDKTLFEIQILTVLCTIVVLVSYDDRVKMFNKDTYGFDYYTMFEKIEKWSNTTFDIGIILSSSVAKKYWYL